LPVRRAPAGDVQYYLLVFDERGLERKEPDGKLLSRAIMKRLADTANPVSDIFFMSHGWKGDVPGAIAQYDAWIGAMLSARHDLDAAKRRPEFEPLIVGLHWPSLPWGEETIAASAKLLLSPGDEPTISIDVGVEAYALRVADTSAARQALRTILEHATRGSECVPLPDDVRHAYAILFVESGLANKGLAGAPGNDQDAFDPQAIIKDAAKGDAEKPLSSPGLLGVGSDLKEAVLAPLRQLSFWKMKDRARMIGETAGHRLIRAMMSAAPKAKVHLMGHSFGSIVASASIAGPSGSARLQRPVDTLFLVQGALSIWAYTSSIPFVPEKAGYFKRVVSDRLVSGSIVTTRSKFDRAVGFFYPLGAGAAGQILLAAEDYPPYGGLGAFGIRGVNRVEDSSMLPVTSSYGFAAGGVYNLEATDVIKDGTGSSGAHNDIAHPEVAHAFWEAAAVKTPRPSGGEVLRVYHGAAAVGMGVESDSDSSPRLRQMSGQLEQQMAQQRRRSGSVHTRVEVNKSLSEGKGQRFESPRARQSKTRRRGQVRL
jgi:hypothetical protein